MKSATPHRKLARTSSQALGESQTGARIPAAPAAISKGVPLSDLLDRQAVQCLAHNIGLVYPRFDSKGFAREAMAGVQGLGILQRGVSLAHSLRAYLPKRYSQAIEILLASLTPANTETSDLGLAVFFYLPHTCFVAEFGLDAAHNGGVDPFEISMQAQYELTKRFTAEYSIRPFLIAQPDRTLERLKLWTQDPDPHVRRLCSEGCRPRLPWAKRIPAFIQDPSPVLPILEQLKDDESLYVRRSVANHLGDIAKDHLPLALSICERWLQAASNERKWLIRHALRHPAKHQHAGALQLRQLAAATKATA